MIGEIYTIWFVTSLDHTNLTISLTAEVEPEQKRYHIKKIRHVLSLSRNLLPDMSVEKVDGEWVYSDSRLANELSHVIGQAIDQREMTSLL